MLYGKRRTLTPASEYLYPKLSEEQAVQAILWSVSLEDYLVLHLNVDLERESPVTQFGTCPFHEDDRLSFMVIDTGERPWQVWNCSGACQGGGTVIEAAMKAHDFNRPEAIRHLDRLYGLGLDLEKRP